VRIEQRTQEGCAVVAFHGRLDLPSVPRFRRVLLKRLAEHPVAVICDLSGLSAIDPACATVFATVANHPVSGWPARNLLLCAARPGVAAVLGRLRVPHFLPLHATVEDAIGNASARPRHLHEELVLGPSPTAPRAARRFVREVCRFWRMEELDGSGGRAWGDELVDRAVLVVDELVTNGVIHGGAGGELRLKVELCGEQLRLAVHDPGPRLLHQVAAVDREAEGGRGLLLVERLVSAWGVRPGERGKVVWCVLDH
jgi:anti-anti-sigma regulatory factor